MNVLNKHGLELIPTHDMSREEWLMRRREGLGGSDMGTIMGANKNFSRLELFYQKCGAISESVEQNSPMFWGSVLEENVRDIAQYLDMETGEYISNYEAGNKLRKLSAFKYMVKNPSYPWLIANVDALEGFKPRSFKAEGIGEIKTISRQSAEMWETFPIYHWFQVEMYHTVLKPILTTDDNKIFYLEDGRILRGFGVSWSESICDIMLTESHDFWELVKKGKEIVRNTPEKDKQLTYLSQIEPEPEGTQVYLDFLSDLYKMKLNYKTIKGNEKDKDHAMTYVMLGREMTELKKQRDLSRVHIIKRLKDESANVMKFDDKGKITYNRKLYVNI
jgi:predicted phage-related endonuclease